MTEPELLTTAQAAERLGKPHRTIIHWAATGRLPVALRLPGKTTTLLFRAADVAEVAGTVTCPTCILHAHSALFPECELHPDEPQDPA